MNTPQTIAAVIIAAFWIGLIAFVLYNYQTAHSEKLAQCLSEKEEIDHAKTGLSYAFGINTGSVNQMIDEYNANCAGTPT